MTMQSITVLSRPTSTVFKHTISPMLIPSFTFYRQGSNAHPFLWLAVANFNTSLMWHDRILLQLVGGRIGSHRRSRVSLSYRLVLQGREHDVPCGWAEALWHKFPSIVTIKPLNDPTE